MFVARPPHSPQSPRRHPEISIQAAIVVIDNRVFTLHCIAEVLRHEFPEFHVFGATTTHNLDVVAGLQVGLVVVNAGDRSPTEPDLLAEMGHLKRSFDGVPIALLAGNCDEMAIRHALACGVKGIITDPNSLSVGVAALRLILAGGTYFPQTKQSDDHPSDRTPDPVKDHAAPPHNAPAPPLCEIDANGKHPQPLVLKSPMLQMMASSASPLCPVNGEAMAGFTTREVQVLKVLQQGRSNKRIAGELGLSENTVKVYIRRIMRKLRATNRTEAVLMAQRLTLQPAPSVREDKGDAVHEAVRA